MDDRIRSHKPEESETASEARRAQAVGYALIRAKHDLNNLFHVARGWSRLLKDPRSSSDQTREGIDAVLSAAEQTNELVTSILALAAHVTQSGGICQLRQELAKLSRGLCYLLDAPDRLKFELGADALVSCHFPEVRRAVIDAVLDARAELGQDHLRLSLRRIEVAHANRQELELALERLALESDTVIETRLSLRFPTTLELVPSLLPADPMPKPEPSPAARNQTNATILLVDDHRDVRRLATTMLERAGHQVLTASDAEEALVTSRSFDGPIHVLCCDARMPGLPAARLITELRAARPELRVLVCSGERPDGELALFPRLAKPFSYQQLIGAVRDCLD